MVWRNPYVPDDSDKVYSLPRDVESVRLATVQLQARAVTDFDDFLGNIEYFVDVAADYRCDFVVFPELYTLPLRSEEHTSELQSLMRTSYAVFCLKKKKHQSS